MLGRLIIKTSIIPLALLLSGVLVALVPPASASALSGSDFKAGRIIDDAVFNNSNAMTVTQIQNFLNAKVPNCDTNGDTLIYDSANGDTVTRKVYSQRRGVSTPFTCLKSFSQTVPTITNSGSDLCTGNISGGNKSAARIIYDVAKACDINPQVLIVMLQKEQSLITDNWPWPRQYEIAMGYGCPDTAPCDSEYYGFFNQVYQAAKAFQRYEANPKNYNYEKNRNNYVYYHPDLSRCGGKTVFIENQSTAGLYIYTPYQPNSAALNNLYGTGNSCSAYGNRNFWRMFNDWFGSTFINIQYSPLSLSRYLETNKDLKKYNLRTGLEVDSTIPVGSQIYFPSKVEIGGIWYLRTEHDTEKGFDKGIRLSDLDEISLTFEAMSSPRWMSLNNDYRKINPVTRKPAYSTIKEGTQIYFTEKATIGGRTYVRTLFDTNNTIIAGIDLASLSNYSPTHTAMHMPRWLMAKDGAVNYDYRTQPTVTTLEAGTISYYDYKTTINGTTYVREGSPATPDDDLGFRLDEVEEIKPVFVNLLLSRYLETNKDLKKYNLRTGLEVDSTIPVGSQIYFPSKVEIGGIWYLRTEHDTEKGFDKGIRLSDLDEISLTFEAMSSPRSLTVKSNTYKLDPVRRKNTYGPIKSGALIAFTEKITIGNITYLRTQHDAIHGKNQGIPMSVLR